MKFQKILLLLSLAVGLFILTNNFSAVPYLEFGGLWYTLYLSFFNDLVQPFGLYFGICLLEPWIPQLKPWRVKVLITFLIPALLEVGQALYYRLPLPNQYVGAFDPLDLVMYASGALLAALVERKVFAKVFSFWD